jgi:glycosyltransferase involved in cell wall biosynthesis
VTLAWFSPLPPSSSGIAAYSAELLPRLAARGLDVTTFTETNAHEFVWMHRRRPYDLTVFQLGNATCHDYMWAYLFRYPGVVVLHDAQLHQARALFLTRRWIPRREDYVAECRANHPDAPADLPYLVLAGMGDKMYQHWPMVRLVIESARMTVVHNRWVAEDLQQRYRSANIRAIDMGVADPLEGASPDGRSKAPSDGRPEASSDGRSEDRLRQVRGHHGIPDDAVVVAAFGGITPEKRIPQVIRAIGAIAHRHPQVHLMLVGSRTAYYDASRDADAAGIADRVHITGFVADDELSGYLLTADVCACLRWPTNRETSAAWLRCLASGRATLVTELAHLGDVPTLDPRGWRLMNTAREARDAVAVSIDMLDEEHSLQLALERLVTDGALRQRLGRAAREWWRAHHRLEPMAAAYQQILDAAMQTAVPRAQLPAHLVNDGSAGLRALARDLDVAERYFLDFFSVG